MLADHAIASIRQIAKRRMFSSGARSTWPGLCGDVLAEWPAGLLLDRSLTSAITDNPIGSIISVVAVLDTHMERKPVASISPNTI